MNNQNCLKSQRRETPNKKVNFGLLLKKKWFHHLTEDRATKRYIEWAILTTRLIELYYINGIIWFWINFFSTFPFYLGWSAQVTYDSFRYTLTYMHNMRIFSFCNGIQNICCISRIFFWFVSSWMSKLIKIPIIRTCIWLESMK